MQARQYADYFGVSVILCMPDEVYPRIPNSVKEFADGQRVSLCSLSEVGNALKIAIGRSTYKGSNL